jgi:muramoyltetrapeptide carboxypeptidase
MVTARPRPTCPPAAPLAWPPALAPGDAVALVSPSSHAGHGGAASLQAAQAILEGWGLRPLPLAEPQPRHLYLAGSDTQRAEAFQRLYCDGSVKALFAARGGYGAARMLPFLDAARIRAAAPKLVVGMSDVVALFAWLHAEAGLGVLHGPCLAAPSFTESPQRAENLDDLRGWLFGPPPQARLECTLLHAPAGAGAHGTGAGGSVAGRLVGGNLAVLASLLGTPWALETQGCLLFLEDVNEQPYRVDRYLTQLRLAGRLDGVAGVVFGHMQRCDSDPPGLLHDVLRDLFRDAPYPVATGLPAGHGARNRTLPLGRPAELTWPAPQAEAAAALTIH